MSEQEQMNNGQGKMSNNYKFIFIYKYLNNKELYMNAYIVFLLSLSLYHLWYSFRKFINLLGNLVFSMFQRSFQQWFEQRCMFPSFGQVRMIQRWLQQRVVQRSMFLGQVRMIQRSFQQRVVQQSMFLVRVRMIQRWLRQRVVQRSMYRRIVSSV